eukprot:TRINITY_DN12258_c0_g1_i1.p1 TRINITY_DN12258_c0_g1~~TRINITY_DN12258_c0_g1_i1.p1  ORF type:complete len:590 (+),score=60.41 TRINITY_DN12258_c0_g1_i1:3-1772(+)
MDDCHDIKMFLEIDEEEDREFICPIGSGIFNDAVSLQCGHTFCRPCITKWCQKNSICPIDRELVISERIAPNYTLRNIVNRKKVACQNAFEVEGSKISSQNECTWKGQLQNLLGHRQKECGYEKIGCMNDGCPEVDLERRHTQDHNQSCQYKLVICNFCGVDSIRLADEKEHLEICPKVDISCPQNCGRRIRRKDQQKHVSEECGYSLVECPCKRLGCGKSIERQKITQHLQENIESHLYLFTDKIINLERQLEVERSQHRNLWDLLAQQSMLIEKQSKELEMVKEKLVDLDQKSNTSGKKYLYLVYYTYDRVQKAPDINIEQIDPITKSTNRLTYKGKIRSGTVAIGYNGKIYHIGGRSTNEVETFANFSESNSGTWSSGPNMLTRRGSPRAAILNGRLYVIGGYDVKSYLKSIEYYCPRDNCWKMGPSLSVERLYHAVAVLNGKMYVIGGRTRNEHEIDKSDVVECYDPVVGQWSFVAPLVFKRSEHAAAVFGGSIYVFGGYDASGDEINQVECFNEKTKCWSIVASNPSLRGNVVATVLAGKIYIVGRGLSNEVFRIDSYDPTTNTWSDTNLFSAQDVDQTSIFTM